MKEDFVITLEYGSTVILKLSAASSFLALTVWLLLHISSFRLCH
jgi:hypothetical protein